MSEIFSQGENPFYERGMIRDPQRFFGRREELSQVFDRLRGMQSVSVVGERRIGKSSFLYYIAVTGNERLSDDYRLHYLDMQRVPDEVDFYRRAVKLLGGQGEDTRALEEALAQEPHRVVLCLDEFEKTANNERFSPDFFDVLRSLCNAGELALMVATQTPLDELCFTEAIKTSPFFNIFIPIHLGPLTEEEATELITVPAQRAGQPFTTEEVRFALDVAGTHPYRLQVLCYHLFEAKKTGQVDWEEVRRRYEEELARPEMCTSRREAATPSVVTAVAQEMPARRIPDLAPLAALLISGAGFAGLIGVLARNPFWYLVSALLSVVVLGMFVYTVFAARRTT